jgi:predicted PurR-regulated permease PerM
MGNIIGLNPIWLIISLFIGGQVGGILGLLLAIPIASVIQQIIDDLRASDTEVELKQP